jgi:hypothetical protein
VVSADIQRASTESLNAVFRRQSLRLLTDPVKGVFVPLSVLSFATIIIGTINYAVPAGIISANGIYVMFWYVATCMRCYHSGLTAFERLYVALALVVSFPMLMVWFNQPHDITTFTPAWAFLVGSILYVLLF